MMPPVDTMPMTPQNEPYENTQVKGQNLQTFLYQGAQTSSQDNIVILSNPTAPDGILSQMSTFDQRNTKVDTDSNNRYNTESNSNLMTLNPLSGRTQDGNVNMPVALSQAKLIQEKAMIPTKQEPVSEIRES